jgi:hypothetical protein
MDTKVKCDKVMDGLMPAEKIARIKTADGKIEDVAVSSQSISGNELLASEIGRREGKVLVELPRETASGRWRIWVHTSSISV